MAYFRAGLFMKLVRGKFYGMATGLVFCCNGDGVARVSFYQVKQAKNKRDTPPEDTAGVVSPAEVVRAVGGDNFRQSDGQGECRS